MLGRSRPSIGAAAAAEPAGVTAAGLQRPAVGIGGRRAHRRAWGARAVHPHGGARRPAGTGLLPGPRRVRRRNARPGGLGQGAGPIRRWRNDCAAGSASAVATPDRLRSPHGRRSRASDAGQRLHHAAHQPGFDPHYDVHDVFVLQAAGQKRWIVHEPVHENPLPSQPWTDHRAAIAERVADEPVIDAVLSPGDALYLPRGWIHSARGAPDHVDPPDHRRLGGHRARRRPRRRRHPGR